MAGPKEQPLPPDVMEREDATEVLRAFVVDGGLSIAFTRAASSVSFVQFTLLSGKYPILNVFFIVVVPGWVSSF